MSTPILLIHGDDDQVVPMQMTNIAHEKLTNMGFKVEKYFCKGLGHGISLDGLTKATEFLKLNISND